MSGTPQHAILVIGAGSVGRRHARNLRGMGARVACFDPRQDRLRQASSEIGGIETFDSLEQAVRGPYTGAVIASPPSVHVAQAIDCLERGLPVLLEKPVAPGLDAALELSRAAARHSVPVLLGYTYRWWPPLQYLHRRIQAGSIGPLRHARFVMSAHLADWHPWERYQDFFMASRELGGGALLDESHFIDLMIWFFGRPEALYGAAEHVSSLEITTDDNVDIVARYTDGFRATIHLDLFGRPHQKSITVVGENGTLECLFDPNEVRETITGNDPQITRFTCDRNDMFVDEVRDFLALIGGSGTVRCSLDDGVRVMQCVEAVRRSSTENCVVFLREYD